MTRRLRTAAVWAFALLAVALGSGGGAAEASEGSADAAFDRFRRAWQAASASQVVDLLGAGGRLRFRVLAPRVVDASWTRGQARKGLAAYFGAKGVSRPLLRDVTPTGRGTRTVRLYDYTYRPHGRDVRTTRLTVTVKQDARKRWVLASVIESARPRPSSNAAFTWAD
ncbi:MAG: hypothetical protein QNJ98_01360 [Planctomycetota bacterium]|nr:hypothetical protein [Planctomycetota bacterium]